MRDTVASDPLGRSDQQLRRDATFYAMAVSMMEPPAAHAVTVLPMAVGVAPPDIPPGAMVEVGQAATVSIPVAPAPLPQPMPRPSPLILPQRRLIVPGRSR
jgi:hypothetical protein